MTGTVLEPTEPEQRGTIADDAVVILASAYHFAACKHVHQRRKGAAAEPYINHLTEVAELVATATGGSDVELVVAAVLHDTVEDTETSFDELTTAFGQRVSEYVREVTDDKSLPKAERKWLQIEHAAHASPGAKLIKLADKTSNLRSLRASPPSDWPEKRLEQYVAWSTEVVAGCRGTNLWLEGQFDEAILSLN